MALPVLSATSPQALEAWTQSELTHWGKRILGAKITLDETLPRAPASRP